MDLLSKIRDVCLQPSLRREFHDYTRKVLKLDANQCAATASLVLIEVAALDRVRTWTADLVAALSAKGWTRHADNSPPIGAVCFSEDLNANSAPDHVYVFLGWEDQSKRLAVIYDNYSAALGFRNYGKAVTHKMKIYAKTPTAFYMLPPAPVAKFNAEEAAARIDRFKAFYDDLQRVPAAHGPLNALRQVYRDAGVK